MLLLLLRVLAAYCVLLLYLFLEKNHKPKLNGNKHTCKKHPHSINSPSHSTRRVTSSNSVQCHPASFIDLESNAASCDHTGRDAALAVAKPAIASPPLGPAATTVLLVGFVVVAQVGAARQERVGYVHLHVAFTTRATTTSKRSEVDPESSAAEDWPRAVGCNCSKRCGCTWSRLAAFDCGWENTARAFEYQKA